MTEADRPAGDETRRHLTHVARGGAIGLIGAGVSATAGFALVLVVTNRYSAETASLFFTATSTFLLLYTIAVLGTETGLSRFLLRYGALDRRGDIPSLLRGAFRVTLGCSIVLGGVVVAGADALADLIGLAAPGGPRACGC